MKRAHRSAHKFLWLILVPVMALVLYGAISQRVDTPVNTSLPQSLPEEGSE